MRLSKRILSIAMALTLSVAPVHASASEALNHAEYNQAMLALTPYADNAQYLINLSDAERIFAQLNDFESSAVMLSYARGMQSLFSGRFAEAASHFSVIADNDEVHSELTEWNLPAAEELMTYAQAADIEVSGGYLYQAADLYNQIPDLFDAQAREAGVLQRMQETGNPASIMVTPDYCEMNVGDQTALSIEFEPKAAYIENLQWFSSDDSVATVDENGIVTAVGSGNAYVAFSKDSASGKSYCLINVKAVDATSMSLPLSQVTMTVGESLTLPLNVQPADAQLIWNSNDPGIVSVQDGVLFANQEGFTNVIVSSGNFTCVCSVTVVPPFKSINEYYGSYIVNRSSAYVNKTTSRSVEAKCAIDGDTSTAWNTNGRWNGEWISLAVSDGQKYRVSSLNIYNGYQRKSSTYYNNPRIKTLEVYCDGAYVTTLTLSDSWGAQEHYLPEPMVGSEFRFVITSVYYGNQFSDCALSELQLRD